MYKRRHIKNSSDTPRSDSSSSARSTPVVPDKHVQLKSPEPPVTPNTPSRPSPSPLSSSSLPSNVKDGLDVRSKVPSHASVSSAKVKSPEPAIALETPLTAAASSSTKGSASDANAKLKTPATPLTASNVMQDSSKNASLQSGEPLSDLSQQKRKGVRFSPVVNEAAGPSIPADNEDKPKALPRQKQMNRKVNLQTDSQPNSITDNDKESKAQDQDFELPDYESAFPFPFPFAGIEFDTQDDEQKQSSNIQVVEDETKPPTSILKKREKNYKKTKTKTPPSILKKRDDGQKSKATKEFEIPPPPAPPPPPPGNIQAGGNDGISPLLKGLLYDQAAAKTQKKITSLDLLNTKRQLKRVVIRDTQNEVALGRKELFDKEYDRLNLELPEFIPLHLLVQTVILNNVSADLTSLNINGLDQVTDMTFSLLLGRPRGARGHQFPKMKKVYLAGCPNITDQGIIWLSELFPQVQMVEMNGCKKVTERGFHYLFMNCPKLQNFVCMACNAALIPNSITNTQLPKGSIQWAGNPIITEGKDYYIKYHGASHEDFFKSNNMKLLIVRDRLLPYRVSPLIKGVQEEGDKEELPFTSAQDIPIPLSPPEEGTHNFNIIETVSDEPMMSSLVSHGAIIMIPFEHPSKDRGLRLLICHLAETICSVLMKTPDVLLLIVEISNTGDGEIFQVVQERLAVLLQALVETTFKTFGDNPQIEYLDYKGQEGLSRGMTILDRLEKLLSPGEIDKRIVHLNTTKEKFSSDIIPILTRCATLVQELAPYVYTDWQVSVLSIIKNLPQYAVSALPTIYAGTSQEGITKRFTTLKITKILKLLEIWGTSVCSASNKQVWCSTDLKAFEAVCGLIHKEKPPHTVMVKSCRADLPVWTVGSLSARMRDRQIKGQAEDVLRLLKRQGMLIRFSTQHYEGESLNEDVFVRWRDIPDKHECLPTMWPEPRPKVRVIQTNHIYYLMPMAPRRLMPKIIRTLLAIYRPLLVWKTGFLVRQGLVDIKAEVLQLKGTKMQKIPAIVFQARVIQLDMDAEIGVEAWRESTDDARTVMFSCCNQIRSVIHYACQKMEIYALDMMPCPKCSKFSTASMLDTENTWHFPFYHGMAFKHRCCQHHKMVNVHFLFNSRVEHMEGLCTPRHNFPYHNAASSFLHEMVAARRYRPMDPPEKCFYCGRESDVPCLHCSMCSECTKNFAKMVKFCQPGGIDHRSFKLRLLKDGEFVDEDKIKSNTKGCVFFYKKGVSMVFHHPLMPFYWDEMEVILLRGSTLALYLEFASGNQIKFDAANGKFTDQNGVERDGKWFVSSSASLVKLRLESIEVGRRVRVFILLSGQVLHSQEVDGWNAKLTLVCNKGGVKVIYAPGIKKSWQLKDQDRFKVGSVLEVSLDDGAYHPAVIKEINTSGFLTLEASGSEHTIIHTSPQLMPTGCARALGKTLASSLPPAPDNGTWQSVPLYVFLNFQVPCGFDKLLRVNKDSGDPIDESAFFEMQKKNPQLPDYFPQCVPNVLPSVVHARQIQLRDPVESKFYIEGGHNYSLGAVMMLPNALTLDEFKLIPQSIVMRDFRIHPLCYVRSDVNSVMTCLPSYPIINKLECYHNLHMLDNQGLPMEKLNNQTQQALGLNTLWAWTMLLLRLQQSPLPQYKQLTNEIEGIDQLRPNQIHSGLTSILEVMRDALFLCVGLKTDVLQSLNEESTKRWTDINEEHHSTQGLYNHKLELVSDHIFICETHKDTWLNNQLTARKTDQMAHPMYTDLPGIYHSFVYSLSLVSNQLTEIPAQLFNSMPNLKDLLLAENKLKVIPSEIGNCTKLNNFSVANNQLTDLPKTLASCQELTRLDMGSNMFERLPSAVTKLKNLSRLYAQYLLLTELPENIGDLENLTMLSLNGNCFTTLPESMGKLQKLSNLTLNGICWLKLRQNVLLSREHFEDFLKSNNLIHWLDKHNQDKQNIFSRFDEDVNGTLDPVEMGKLNATMFQVFPRFGYKGRKPPDEDCPSGFPKVLLQLKSLEYLSMQYHGLVSVPEAISNLTNLKTIHLGNNPNLLTIPAQLGGLHLKRLELEGCPLLKTPPKEIRAKGFLTTHAYLKRLLSGSVSCQRTKLMLVGLGGAGKTSLVKALLSGNARTELTVGEEITDGIDICPWTVSTPEGSITYSVWDFAGQTVYYNTHQFFLTDRAVYFLLWNIRLGHEHAGLDFWLSSIRVHAPKAPIFVVGTHLDQVSKVELPMKEMKSKFPQICGFHFVSSHTGRGIEDLQQHMIKVTLTQRYMGEKIPGVWLTFEENLKSIENKNVIEFKELETRANRSGICDDNDIRQAVQFLHELGSLQYFTNAGLKSHVVVNPQWIVDVMACVVSVKDSPIKAGRFKHADVHKVWSSYDPDLHTWMLHLTEEFDLTFPLKDKPINLVPCLLPEKKPEFEWPAVGTGVYAKETKMSYKFDYFPAGLFNRAQVRLHQFSDSALIWKRGSYLKKNGHICLLIQSRDLQLTVKAIGPRPENILFMVHEVFETLIVESFKGITYDFSVPCPDCLKMNLKDPHMFEASTIRRATELKAPFLQCLKHFHTISITDLHAIMPPDSNQDFDLHLSQAVRGMKELQCHLASDIFVSYCPLDANDPNGKSVSPSHLCKDVEKLGFKCWMPNASKPQSLDEMAKALQESKVFVVFMSNNFVKDETCCNLFKYARLTLKKQIVLIAVGPDLDWRQSSMGILTSDELFIDMRSMTRYQQKFQELTTMLQEKHNLKKEKKKTYPPCFISYCWQNSAQAVAKGSRTTEGAVGYGDPRVIKDYLESKGVSCWIDVERVGLHGLFEDIGVGLLNSKVMLVCMSDQYALSDNCSLEFRYGANTLKLPVVLAVVGSGNKWRASEVGIMSLNYPLVSFQENSEAAMNKLLEQVKSQLPTGGDDDKEKSNKDSEKDDDGETGAEEKQKLSLQELCEMAQRKFLRQVNQYAELEDSDPYPNIMLVDFWVEEKGKLESLESEKKDKDKENNQGTSDSIKPPPSPSPSPSPASQSQRDKENNKTLAHNQPLPDHGDFYDQKFAVSLLCEHEEGWHVFGEPLPLDSNFGHSLEMFLPYIARVTALARYSRKLTLNLLASVVGRKYMNWLEENPKVTATCDFHESFQGLRQLVQKADTSNDMGSLKRCILPNGKLTWLCPTHRSSMRVSLLESKQSMASMQSVSESLGVDLMVKAMREMDFGFLPPKFVKDPAMSDEVDGPRSVKALSIPTNDSKPTGAVNQPDTQNQQQQQQQQQQEQPQDQSKETPRRQVSRMNSKSRACLLM